MSSEYTKYSEEFRQIRKSLEKIHAVFYTLWDIGEPYFTESIPTAAIGFNYQGQAIEFRFNPKFWVKLTHEEKVFVICHEIFHILLSHGSRIRDTKHKDIANIALDIVVNENLVQNVGFSKDRLPNLAEQMCWQDNVFKDVPNIQRDREFEYYYNKLVENANIVEVNIGSNGEFSLVGPDGKARPLDDHSELPDDVKDKIREFVKEKMKESLTEREKETLKDLLKKTGDCTNMTAGSTAGDIVHYVPKRVHQHNRKWQDVIKTWAKRKINDVKQSEQWITKNRRFALLDDSLLIPTDGIIEAFEEIKQIDVWFFQDTSGSCASWADRFFDTAMTFPEKVFNVTLHCFDTQVYPVDPKLRKLQGFGGTCFKIIEDYIRAETQKKNIKYPDAVFIFTDGFGTPVTPEKPEKWYWFLTQDGSTDYISKDSYTFDLKDFLI